jgi:hypothetical protein
VKGVFDKAMIKVIKKNLNIINSQSRQLILSNIYSQIAFYEENSLRRLQYLNAKHLKYASTTFTLKFILKIRRTSINPKYKAKIFVKKFAVFIEKYHKHNIISKSH